MGVVSEQFSSNPAVSAAEVHRRTLSLHQKKQWNSHLLRSASHVVHGILLDGIKAVVREPILESGTDRVAVREVLLA